MPSPISYIPTLIQPINPAPSASQRPVDSGQRNPAVARSPAMRAYLAAVERNQSRPPLHSPSEMVRHNHSAVPQERHRDHASLSQSTRQGNGSPSPSMLAYLSAVQQNQNRAQHPSTQHDALRLAQDALQRGRSTSDPEERNAAMRSFIQATNAMRRTEGSSTTRRHAGAHSSSRSPAMRAPLAASQSQNRQLPKELQRSGTMSRRHNWKIMSADRNKKGDQESSPGEEIIARQTNTIRKCVGRLIIVIPKK